LKSLKFNLEKTPLRVLLDSAILAAVLVSCDVAQDCVLDSFVQAYVKTGAIYLLGYDESSIAVRIAHDRPGSSWYTWYGSTETRHRIYDSLCTKHGDHGFNRHFRVIDGGMEITIYPDADVREITVTCSTDFDARHPAGTPLDDIIRLASYSPYKYIQSGYTDTYSYQESTVSESFAEHMGEIFKGGYGNDKDPYNINPSCYHPVDVLLSDAVEEDFILIGPNESSYSPLALLVFESGPSESGPYEITATIQMDNGTTYSPSVVMNFQ